MVCNIIGLQSEVNFGTPLQIKAFKLVGWTDLKFKVGSGVEPNLNFKLVLHVNQLKILSPFTSGIDLKLYNLF